MGADSFTFDLRLAEATAAEFIEWAQYSPDRSLEVALDDRADHRGHVVGTIAAEVRRAATAVQRGYETLHAGNAGEGTPGYDVSFGVQVLWARKLSEILADLVCFAHGSPDLFFRLFLVAAELEAFTSDDLDFREFWGRANGNTERACQNTFELLCLLSAGLPEHTDLWFANPMLKNALKKGQRPKSVPLTCSFRSRLKMALKGCRLDERPFIGPSYIEYSGTSRDVHIPYRSGQQPNRQRLEGLINHSNGAIFHVLARLEEISGFRPASGGSQVVFDPTYQKAALKAMNQTGRGDFEMGDLVLAKGNEIGEVAEVHESPYGYRSWRVRHLSQAAAELGNDDWYPSPAVKRLVRKSELLLFYRWFLLGAVNVPPEPADIRALTAEEAASRAKGLFRGLPTTNILATVETGRRRV